MTRFTYRSARSGSLSMGFGLAILVEMTVLHLVLVARHPMIAWVLTASSLAALVWLAADYRALGREAVSLDENVLQLRVGRRFDLHVPRAAVRAVIRPDWRDLPQAGAPEAAGFLNLTKPATPNVLVTLDAPLVVRLPGGISRRAQRIALHLDDPNGFIASLTPGAPPGDTSGVSAA